MVAEDYEAQRKADEQAALDAEMERRRQRVEEWRRKKMTEKVCGPSSWLRRARMDPVAQPTAEMGHHRPLPS